MKKEQRNEKNCNKKLIIIIIILLLLLLLSVSVTVVVVCVRGYVGYNNVPSSMQIDKRLTNVVNLKEDNPLEGRNVHFSGIEDSVIGKSTIVQLTNMEENLDFLMTYEIYNSETDVLVFKTDLIPSGQCVNWVPGETLEPGTYVLNIRETPHYEYSPGEYLTLTQGCNTVTFTILDN